MSTSNPIQRNIEKLDEQWDEFLNSKLPILRWYFSPDDIELALGFISVKEQLDEKNPELFIGLHADFLSAATFSAALADEMNSMIEEGIADAALEEAQQQMSPRDIPTWTKPDVSDCPTGYNALFRSATQVVTAFGDYVHYIVLVVIPAVIKDSQQYTAWWRGCCDINSRYRWPENFKLVFFDTDRHSPLATLARENPAHLYTLDAPVDLNAAIQAVLQEADDGSPAALFRKLTVDLQQAVGKQDRAAMENISSTAITLAQQHHWLDMWVVTLLTRAAGYLGLQIYEAALMDYRTAQMIAAQGERESVPGCNKLQLQAMVCEGTCLFSAGHFDEAAVAYANGAGLAESQQDPLMTLEGWRMASFCMERVNQPKIAWDYGMKAFEAGSKMDEQQRAQSTLPFLGQALLRISPNGDVDQHIKQNFTGLLGEGWLERAESLAC